MTFSFRSLIFLFGALLFIVIFELVRKKKLREELSLVWLLIGLSFMLSPVADFIIDPLAFKLGISYPPALIFMLLFFFVVAVILYFSVVVSDLKSRNKELSQKIALMEYKILELYKKEDR